MSSFAKYFSFLIISQVLSAPRFYEIIGLIFPATQRILRRQLDETMEDLKQMNSEDVGSAKRMVTTSDGAWLTRGCFSKNFTFTIRYMLTCEPFIIGADIVVY